MDEIALLREKIRKIDDICQSKLIALQKILDESRKESLTIKFQVLSVKSLILEIQEALKTRKPENE